MPRNRLIAVIAVIAAAILVAVLAFGFVNTAPSVPDGGAEDTNIGDSTPGAPDGGSAAGNPDAGDGG
jgi:hypothetical protein